MKMAKKDRSLLFPESETYVITDNKNTNPEVCRSRDNGVLCCKVRNYF